MADNKNFIQENIVGRKEGPAKKILHYFRVVLSAVLFGAISAGVFAFAFPYFDKYMHPEEPATMALGKSDSYNSSASAETKYEDEKTASEQSGKEDGQNEQSQGEIGEEKPENENIAEGLTDSDNLSENTGSDTNTGDNDSGVDKTKGDNTQESEALENKNENSAKGTAVKETNTDSSNENRGITAGENGVNREDGGGGRKLSSNENNYSSQGANPGTDTTDIAIKEDEGTGLDAYSIANNTSDGAAGDRGNVERERDDKEDSDNKTSVDRDMENLEENRDNGSEMIVLRENIRSELSHYRFSLIQYEAMLTSLQGVVAEAENALCEVIRSTRGTDVLGLELSSEISYSGIFFARSGTEILLMTRLEAVEGVESVQVKLFRKYRHEAFRKAVDRHDGIAVLSIPLEDLSEEEIENLHIIPLGSSRLLRQGDILLAIGAPAGHLYSMDFSFLSYHAENRPELDRTTDLLLSDISGSNGMGTYVLNIAGELVGWTSESVSDEKRGDHLRIIGISDYIDLLSALSNGSSLPYIGLVLQDVDEEMQEQGLPKGMVVLGTEERSPAFQSGIQAGDVLVRMDKTVITDSEQFEKLFKEKSPGDRVTLSIKRQKGDGDEYVELPFEMVLEAR